MLSPILLLGLAEAGLRVAGYGCPTEFFLGPDDGGMYRTNERFGWRFFPRALARAPQPCILSAKSAGSVRIFVLGSSAAMGTPDAAYSVGRILEVMLRERYPGVRFEVVNGAMTAINSHAALEIARDCATREPDLFVIYMGNNEVIGPYGPGTVFQHWSPGVRWIRASLRVKATRVGQLLGGLSEALHSKADAVVRWRGMEMFSNNPVVMDDPRLGRVYDNYRQNLNDICCIARNAGAGVVLSTVAVNLRDCPPFASRHRPGLSPAELARWDSLCQSALSSLSASNRLSEALGQFEAAAKIDDRFAELQYRLGECLLKAGRPGEARARFELARDLDALRFRADSRINAIIREVAGEQASRGVRFVDAERELAESDPLHTGVAGDELFYEHVHLTFDGNYLLARSVLERACEALPQLSSIRECGAIPSRQRCAERLALTPWDEYRSAASMAEMTSRAPFTNQSGHKLRQAAARRRTDALRGLAMNPTVMEAAWKTYEAALAGAPDDWRLHYQFGMFALGAGRPDAAVEHLRTVVAMLPWDTAKHHSLGDALAAKGQVEEAIVQYRKALELMPQNAEAYNNLGIALARSGRADEAVVDYRKALEIDPDNAEAHNNLARTLADRGQADESMEHFRKALEIRPDWAEAHSALGLLLAGRGQTDEAADHYKKALEVRPDWAEVHNNLGVILASRHQAEAAVAQFQKALEIKPDYAEAHSNLGPVLFQNGRKEEALAHFRKAVELKPDSAEARLNLGVALKLAGKVGEAVPHFRRVLELQPGNAVARKNLDAAQPPAPQR